ARWLTYNMVSRARQATLFSWFVQGKRTLSLRYREVWRKHASESWNTEFVLPRNSRWCRNESRRPTRWPPKTRPGPGSFHTIQSSTKYPHSCSPNKPLWSRSQENKALRDARAELNSGQQAYKTSEGEPYRAPSR